MGSFRNANMAKACTASPIWMSTWACGEMISFMGKVFTSIATEIGSRANSKKERKLAEDFTNIKVDLSTTESGRKIEKIYNFRAKIS